jgi:peroxiredoxin
MAFTLQLGESAPDFHLPGADGGSYSLSDFDAAKVLIVAFTCNHCPFVLGTEDRLIAFYDEVEPKGVALVTINSNETVGHPGDSFDHMVTHAKEKGFRFPYLRDDDQTAAKAYGALRTPHFYVFGPDRKLAYTGRFDDNPRDLGKATTRDLRDAVDAVLAGRPVETPLTNPIGCNVKWSGQEEHWMPAEACDLV